MIALNQFSSSCECIIVIEHKLDEFIRCIEDPVSSSSVLRGIILTIFGLQLDSEAERGLVEDLARLQKPKGRGGSVKMKAATNSSRPQRKKSVAAKANRRKLPISPGLSGTSGPG